MSTPPAAFKPKIIAYWLGWTAETDQAYPKLQGIPDYVDVVILAFALVQKGQVLSGALQVPCPSHSYACDDGCTTNDDGTVVCQSTCLLDTTVDPQHTRENLKIWIADAKSANPNLKFLLSIGGARYCDWNSINDLPGDTDDDKAQAFANNVKGELDLWNDQSQLIDGVDIDYEFADCCGSPVGDQPLPPPGPSIVDVIKAVAEILPGDKILSLPLFSGSPSNLTDQLDDLKTVVTFASTMDYGCDTRQYSQYQEKINWVAMGFATPSPSSRSQPDQAGVRASQTDPVTPCFDSAAHANPPVTLSAGMLWNLGNPEQTPRYLELLNANLNQ